MARIPDDIVDRIKREVSLVDLITAKGYEVKKHGAKNVAICCPFHRDDKTPSLIITPEKNLFNCLACGASGSPIDWQMKIERVSFRHAVEQLKALLPGESSVYEQSERVAAEFTPLAANLAASGELQKLTQHVVKFYHQNLKQSTDDLTYLEKRGLNNAELIETFMLGSANRTLGYLLPPKRTAEGDLIRGQLQEIGLLRDTGHEHFNGSIVVPIMDENGVITEIYGRKVQGHRLKKGTPLHTYLPGPHQGIWNPQGLKATDEVILCESLIDAMTFWVHGFRNVTASYGTGGFTEDHLRAFKANQIKRVYIAYDRDQAGDTAAETLAKKLVTEGFVCYRVLFPKGIDANEYALKVTPAVKSLELALRQAEWLGGNDDTTGLIDAVEEESAAEDALAVAAKEKESSGEKNSAEPSPSLAAKAATSYLMQSDLDAEISDHEIRIAIGSRLYRIRGLEKNVNYDQLKVNMIVKSDAGLHVDTFDMGQSKQRAFFVKEAAQELNIKVEVIKEDVAKLYLKLEDLRYELLTRAKEKKDEVPAMTDEERESALTFLRDPHLLDRILDDFKKAGMVGEETNRLVGYLACVSRKFDRPLAIMIQSTSAAGKSALMDSVLALMPEEERVQYSAMSGQSLFYMKDKNLENKILGIAEEEGAQSAGYALKLLLSEGKVTMASTGKDPITGNLQTRDYEVKGPVSLFYTTTSIDIDEELKNRCVVLTVDESEEQTAAIHVAQRSRRTLEGITAKRAQEAIVKQHQNAQRLLRPIKVVNHYANYLTFVKDKTRTRRDHEKYLTLIETIALLHQYQREPKKKTDERGEYDFIEVILSDIAIANKLSHEVLGRTLDELPPQTKNLLGLIKTFVDERCQAEGMTQQAFRFSRREVREFTGWSLTQLQIHFQRLEDYEYLIVHSGGRGSNKSYELLFDGDAKSLEPHLMGLIDVEKLRTINVYDAKILGQKASILAPSEAHLTPILGPSEGSKNQKYAAFYELNRETEENPAKTHSIGKNNGASHRTDSIVVHHSANIFPAPTYRMADSEGNVYDAAQP